jgi:hypothetical protein
MREPLQTKGLWWTPEKPRKQLPGELKYIPDEKIELETIGIFSGASPTTRHNGHTADKWYHRQQ